MEIRINKSFLKELAKLPQNQRKKVEDFIFFINLKNTNTCMKYLAFKNLEGNRIITDYVSEVTEPGYDLKIMYYTSKGFYTIKIFTSFILNLRTRNNV